MRRHVPRSLLTAVPVEDQLVYRTQRLARIHTELVHQPFTRMSIRIEGVRLSTTAVLGEHQLPRQPLVERVGLQRRTEVADYPGTSAGEQRSVVAVHRNR